MQLMKHGDSVSLRNPISFIHHDKAAVGREKIFIPVYILGVTDCSFERGDRLEDLGVEFAGWRDWDCGSAGVVVCSGTDLVDDEVLDGGEEGKYFFVS